MNLEDRSQWVARVASICLFTQVVVSWPLWFPINRVIPKIPLWFPLELPASVDILVSATLCAMLMLSLWRPGRPWFWRGVWICLTILVLEDVNRLQPWVFVFVLMTQGYLLPAPPTNRLGIIRVVFITMYFWSGVLKWNPAFETEIFPWFMEPLGLGAFAREHPWLAHVASVLEVGGGVALLWSRTRWIGLVALTGMHTFILYSLGPIGHDWNAVVWPWNLALIVLLWLVFAGSIEKRESGSRWHVVPTLIVSGVLPVFHVFGLWDANLSHTLYTGDLTECTFFFHEKDRQNLPAGAGEFAYYLEENPDLEFIIVDHWAMNELHVPFYPEERCYRKLCAYLCADLWQPDSSYWIIMELDVFTSIRSESKFTCPDVP